MKVVVYLRAEDEKMLREGGETDPALWVRGLVKWALQKKREKVRASA